MSKRLDAIFEVGVEVQVRHEAGWYSGTVAAIDGAGNLTIHCDDNTIVKLSRNQRTSIRFVPDDEQDQDTIDSSVREVRA